MAYKQDEIFPVRQDVQADDGISLETLPWENIIRKEGFYVTVNLTDTSAATAANYGMFFTAYHPCEILSISEVHGTKSTQAGATLQVEKLTSTTAKGSGDTILVTAFALDGANNTVVFKNGTDFDNTAPAVATDGLTRTQLSQGERLALKPSATLTALKDVQVTVFFKTLGRGHYTP
jgi:hypothetical protein